jgi:hypothetical protein
MSRHHHSNHSQGQNKTSSGGVGKFLSNIDINQLTSLLSSVDVNQITSLISKFSKGSKNESKVSTVVPSNNTSANVPTTLNSLQRLGVLSKEELNSALSRFTEQIQGQTNQENISDSNQAEGVNEIAETIKTLLGNIDTNELLNLINKLNLGKEQ